MQPLELSMKRDEIEESMAELDRLVLAAEDAYARLLEADEDEYDS